MIQLENVRLLEKTILYQAHLLAFANNFVSCPDLYSPAGRALFEMGTMILDGREFTFCVRVPDRDRHIRRCQGEYMFIIYAAISDVEGTATLNVNKRSDMNSLKPIADTTRTAFPKAKAMTEEEVATRRLDDVMDEFAGLRDRPLFLKVDTQGNELEVIRGAAGALDRIVAIQLEMSLVPMYKGESVYLVLLNELDRLGFDLHLVLPGYFSRALGRQLQFDGLLIRRSK